MRSLKFLAIAVAVVALASPAMAANSLTVTGAAALDGAYGLSVNADQADPNGDAYVVTDHPTGETIYRGTFNVHPGTLDMDVGAAQFRYFLMGDASSTSHAPGHFMFFYIMETASGFWRLQVNARQDDGSFKEWQTTVPICDGANPGAALGCTTLTDCPIRFEWAAATSNGANDGYIKVERSWDGGTTYSPGINITGLDNDLYTVDAAWFGMVFMANNTHNNPGGANFSGSYYFDSFTSFRTAAP